MTDHILQGLLFVMGSTAVLLACKTDSRAKWGWTIGALAQPVWMYVTLQAGQWGLFLLSVIYLWGWTEGAWVRWFPAKGNAQ